MNVSQEPEHPGTSVSQPHGEGDDAIIGRALIISLVVIVSLGGLAACVVGVFVFWPRPQQKTQQAAVVAAERRQAAAVTIPKVNFRDFTREAGITFVHENGASGEKLLPETMGGGVAFFDLDNDGDQDLLLVNSCRRPAEKPVGDPDATMALYRNDGTGHFEDVTADCGLDVTFYGMGVAVGDYDNDGWRDVFISGVYVNRLFRNDKGRFVDVTGQAGVGGGGQHWSTSCGWFDYNNDGRLDLFVCNYLKWSATDDLMLGGTIDGVNRAYQRPQDFSGVYPYLYRNEGNGRFTDVSSESGVQIDNPSSGGPQAKGLGVIFLDLDRDGWMDILVANDTVVNHAFHNQGDGKFEEIGNLIGIDVGEDGTETGAMGIDGASIRRTGMTAVAIGNFANEPTSLYVDAGGRMSFSDEAMATGVGPETKRHLTFGVFFFDYDLDGRVDLLAANGHLENEITKIRADETYAQPPQLFWNAGENQPTEFVKTTAEQVGSDLLAPMVGRGCAYADIDGDGDLDALITAVGAPPRLLRNDQNLGHHWLRLKLVGRKCNRDAIGARIEVHAGGRVFRRQVAPTRSYLSQVELPVTIGLGKATKIDRVTIHWPDGSSQQVAAAPIDNLTIVKEDKAASSKN